MLPQKIKNLKNVILAQDRDMKDDKPLDAWKPSAKNFKVSGKYYDSIIPNVCVSNF